MGEDRQRRSDHEGISTTRRQDAVMIEAHPAEEQLKLAGLEIVEVSVVRSLRAIQVTAMIKVLMKVVSMDCYIAIHPALNDIYFLGSTKIL